MPISHVVIHVPHSSRYVPGEFRHQFAISDNDLAATQEALVDHDTDVMADGLGTVVKFGYSRLLVDVERFWDDTAEEMAGIGMGALYRVDHELRPIRRELDRAEVAELRGLYDAHHSELESAVETALGAHGRCLIIDLHSYPKVRQTYEQGGEERPELCLGTDPFHTPESLVARAELLAAERGIEVARNSPFAGTLVPTKYYGADDRVQSLMFEWRRDLYRSDRRSDLEVIGRIREFMTEFLQIEE